MVDCLKNDRKWAWFSQKWAWLLKIRARFAHNGSYPPSRNPGSATDLYATYPGGSICECGLSVHDSHRLKAQSYVHATYLSGSICKISLSVHTFTDCSHRAIIMLLILVEVPVRVKVSVKVACRSTTATG